MRYVLADYSGSTKRWLMWMQFPSGASAFLTEARASAEVYEGMAEAERGLQAASARLPMSKLVIEPADRRQE